jgi:crotonobetainyl-CoA:carnitine CoA-transferase CaiB-like acyl-CoA transferase
LLNIRVVELAQHLSGPYCGWMLASLGAQVIKVEPPGAGEGARGTRRWRTAAACSTTV